MNGKSPNNLNLWIDNDILKRKLTGYLGMTDNQFTTLKILDKGKNQRFILPFLYELYHRVT